MVSYRAPNGRYSVTGGYFASPRTVSPLRGGEGRYTYGAGVPGNVSTSSYWVDVTFVPAPPPGDTTAPTLTSSSPLAGSSSVPDSTAVTATLSEPVDPASVAMTVTPAGGAQVAGTTSYDAGSGTARFVPAAPLARGIVHTVVVSADDAAGNPMASGSGFSFRTMYPAATPGVCPCGLWDDTAVPATVTVNDPASVEVGMTFSVEVAGQVTGMRFYKGPGNTGTHVGTVWTNAGAALAQATFTNESSSGWQSVTFAQPLNVVPGRTYVVSYRATNGSYSTTKNYFNSARVASPLRAGKGRYTYAAGFPRTASAANYWVDVTFSPAA